MPVVEEPVRRGAGVAGAFAYGPALDGPDEEPWQPPEDGAVIRLMGEHTVKVPLWGADGLMFDDPEEVVRELGVSRELAAALEAWAAAWQTEMNQASHDAEAARLVRRLRQEVGGRYRFVYDP